MIYVIPEDISEIALMYTEIAENDSEGVTFSINTTLG